jgi:hypothetical protein
MEPGPMDLRGARGAGAFAAEFWTRLWRRLRAAVLEAGRREDTDSAEEFWLAKRETSLFLRTELLLDRLAKLDSLLSAHGFRVNGPESWLPG